MTMRLDTGFRALAAAALLAFGTADAAEWKFNNGLPEGRNESKQLDQFAADVAELSDNSLNITKARALLHAYESVRPLSDAERNALPLLSRGACLRFLLTRLYDWLNHPEGALVIPKDPMEYWQRLRFHRGISGPGAYGLD